MSNGDLENCPICDKPIQRNKHWDGTKLVYTRTWPCVHTSEEYQKALEEYEYRIWDMSLEFAGEDA